MSAESMGTVGGYRIRVVGYLDTGGETTASMRRYMRQNFRDLPLPGGFRG